MNSQAPSAAQARWLLQQLPDWLARGLVDAETAQRLRDHHVAAAQTPPRGPLISALLGAGLCVAGLILLLAHNWDDWSRTTRTVLSLLPLLLAQLLSLHVLRRRADSAAWRESAAVTHLGAIAASIALIGQTYHLPGALDSFLLICLLLSWPLIYLLQSLVAAGLYLGALALWVGHSPAVVAPTALYLGLLALAVPYAVQEWRRDRHSRRSTALMTMLTLNFALACTFGLRSGLDASPLVFSSLAAAAVLADARWFGTQRSVLGRLGRFGVAVIALLLAAGSGEGQWSLPSLAAAPGIEQAAQALLMYAPLCAVLVLWPLATAQPRLEPLLYGALPAVWLLTQTSLPPGLMLVLLNLYALALGSASLREGLRTQHASTMRFGLLVILALGLMRFLGTDLPYWLRGLAFVLAGVGFLLVNLWLQRRNRL